MDGVVGAWAARGSQLQMQLYVNHRPRELSAAVLAAFPELAGRDASITWTAPLEREGFREPRDRDFLRAVEREDLAENLASFWPSRGPVWDGLAIVRFPSGDAGVLLAEGKSYPKEFYAGGSKAVSAGSIERIRRSITATQEWLGLEADPDRWLKPLREDASSSLYQSANRYAHLYWLRELAETEAWFVHTLFTDDVSFKGASRDEWEVELPVIEADLGLTAVRVPYAEHVFLPALGRGQLQPEPA
jgi:hypothetical protein